MNSKVGSKLRLQEKLRAVAFPLIRKFLGIFGLEIIRSNKHLALKSDAHRASIVKNWLLETNVNAELFSYIIKNIEKSHGQLQQDLLAQWIYAHCLTPHPGYFVEFGATDGVSISNTYLLEMDGWQGILAEPAQNWHSALIKNRRVIIDKSCVYSKSNQKIEFFESEESEYSTVFSYRDSDAHSGERTKGSTYLVDTISLEDLLKKHDAPKCITYLSIDTEGSEWEILKEFNFVSFEAIFLSIEHNYNQNRENIRNLLTSKGYIQIFEKISAFEDWFINPKYFDTRKLFVNASN